jgi:hypothetical protein
MARRSGEALQLLKVLARAAEQNAACGEKVSSGTANTTTAMTGTVKATTCWMVFSPRKAAMIIYTMHGFKPLETQLAKLRKHCHSSSCLYLTRLDTIDLNILGNLIGDSVS